MTIVKSEILAKSNGTTLKNHSEAVSRIAVGIAKRIMPYVDDEVVEAIRIGGHFHDVAKCTKEFQNRLVKTKDVDALEYKIPFRHNEVGWAFLSRHLNIKNKRILNMVLNCVYWHHGISNEMNSYNDTDISIQSEDLKKMIDYCKTIVEESIVYEKEYKPKKAPRYYVEGENEKEINALNAFVRACVVSADQIVSSNEYTGNDEEILNTAFNSSKKNFNIDITKHVYYGNDRFMNQIQIIKDTGRTTVVKAPGGYGKTLIGILFMILNGEKVIWVCPRNEVAYSVYYSILQELKSFGIDNISVELFLTGEVKANNNSFSGVDFSSDIIITNIDNYLSPSVDSKNSNRLYTILTSTVVFDEYHELIGDAGLFACFINLMRLRHQLTKSKTLLLSATPIRIEFLWETKFPDAEKTVILPNIEGHYPGQHQKKYEIITSDDFNIKNKEENNLAIYNAISNSQYQLKKFDDKAFLIHSSFNESDKKQHIDYIYNSFGKNSPRTLGKPITVGTPIIQASLDVSFCHVYESILSPEATLQRFARCDRFGDYNVKSTFNIVRLKNNSAENMVRDILYTKELTDRWFDCMSKYNGQEITIDKFYLIYNKYYQDNKEILERYVIDKHNKSLNQLSQKVYPVKHYFKKSKKDKKIIHAGGNKLRAINSGFFTICRNYNAPGFSEPMNISCYDITKFYEDVTDNKQSILKTMKEIRNSNDDRFDFDDMIKKKKIIYSVYGKRSDMPHIDLNKVYSPVYGIIEENALMNLL